MAWGRMEDERASRYQPGGTTPRDPPLAKRLCSSGGAPTRNPPVAK